MEESLKNVIELEKKLTALLPYIKDMQISKVVEWAKEDLEEMKKLKNELIIKGLFEKANGMKEKTIYQINKKSDVEKNILEVYRIIGKELEEWRKIYLKIVKV